VAAAATSAASNQSSTMRAVVGLGLVSSIVLVVGLCLFALLVAGAIYRQKKKQKPGVAGQGAMLPRSTSARRARTLPPPVPPDRKLNGTPPPPLSWSAMRYSDAQTPSPPSAVLSFETQQGQRATAAGVSFVLLFH
jgi:hypothetical protein